MIVDNDLNFRHTLSDKPLKPDTATPEQLEYRQKSIEAVDQRLNHNSNWLAGQNFPDEDYELIINF